MNTLITHFPTGYTPNKSQQQIINDIEQAFADGHKFVICCAPTGTGKSFIAKTLANASSYPSNRFTQMVESYDAFRIEQTQYTHEDACNEQPPFGMFALTITKSLQDQYENFFEGVRSLKGKANYQCAVDTNYPVDFGPCVHIHRIRDDCWSKDLCPYYNARTRAVLARFTTLNYKMFFALPNHVKNREYIVCDEASELEDEIVREFSTQITYDYMKLNHIKMTRPRIGDYQKMQQWVNELIVKIVDECSSIESKLGKNVALTEEDESEKLRLLDLKNTLNSFLSLQETWYDSEYIIESIEDGVSFCPLKIDKLTKRLFNRGQKIVLMSATIIDHANFAKTLGITDYKYVETQSPFDPKKAPIHILKGPSLNAKNLQANLPKIAGYVRKIVDAHKNHKGVIHTHTNAITAYLKDHINNDRFLVREPGVNNEQLIQMHSNTDDPTVIISPSMTFGVDLKDDLARFQIIIKAPYAPLLSKRVQQIAKEDPDWYEDRMLSNFVQACGRGVRSKEDHCVTYVLDGRIKDVVIKCVRKFPKYFIDRFV